MDPPRSTSTTTTKIYYRFDQSKGFPSITREFFNNHTQTSESLPNTVSASVTYQTKTVCIKPDTSAINAVEKTNYVDVGVNGASKCKKTNKTDHSTRNKVQKNVPGKSYISNCRQPTAGNLQNGSQTIQALEIKNGELISGSLDGLIRHLVPTEKYYPDKKFVFAFLLCSRIFVRNEELLKKIYQIWSNHFVTTQANNKEKVQKLCTNLLRVLSEWTETFPNDFSNEDTMKSLVSVTSKCLEFDNRNKKFVARLIQNLHEKLDKWEKYDENFNKIQSDAELIINNVKEPVTDICPRPDILAQQLTLIELEKLGRICPEEFVNSLATHPLHYKVSPRESTVTKNVEAYVAFFNRISYFVATQVCCQTKKRHRAQMIEYFIEVASDCFNSGNFNSTMAIISGLTTNPVTRLKKTWSTVDNVAKLEILERQMDPSSNFLNYRSTLKAAVWRSQKASDRKEKVVVPFFSLLLKDLHFLNEGCVDKLANGNINFLKFWKLASQVNDFLVWQKVFAPYQKDSNICQYLFSALVLTEEELIESSFNCEQQENPTEKDIMKKLRWKLRVAVNRFRISYVGQIQL
ncbi:hypothetical protein CHUAL_009778 [Chamberlinius hualienensis]